MSCEDILFKKKDSFKTVMEWFPFLLLLYMITTTKAVFNEFCDYDHAQSNIFVIVGFFSIGNSSKCEKFTNVYRKYIDEEAKFMQEDINKANISPSLNLTRKIVGVICDTCGDAQLARILAVSMLNNLRPEKEEQNNIKLIGVIGDSLYDPAYEIAKVLNDSGRADIKQIVHFTDSKELNSSHFRHLLQPLENLPQTMVNFSKTWNWSSIVLLHSDNVYDQENAKSIADIHGNNSICSITLPLKNTSHVIMYMKSWIDSQYTLPSLIFLSDVDTIYNLLKENRVIIDRYQWVLSDALLKAQILSKTQNIFEALMSTEVLFLQKKFIDYSISKLLENITIDNAIFRETESNSVIINKTEIESNDQILRAHNCMIEQESKIVSNSSSSDNFCPRCQDCLFNERYQVVEGDVYILSFLSIHQESQEPFHCDQFDDVVFMTAEAFHFAIKQLNKKEGIFKNIYKGLNIPKSFKIGSILVDDCDSSLIAADIFLDIINKSNKYKGIPHDKIIAIIGSISSHVTSTIVRLAERLHIPVISPASTSTELNDELKYPYFMRTVPDDDTLARALVSLATHLKWNIMSVAYQDNLYGKTALESFKDSAVGKICLSKTFKLSTEILKTDDFNILYDQPIIRGIIVYASVNLSRKFLSKFNQYSLRGRYSLIGTESWGDQMSIIKGLENASSFYSFNYNDGHYDDFLDYFKKQTPLSKEVTKWYKDYYEYKNCESNIMCNYSKSLDIQSHPWIATVRDAVYAAVRGVLEIYEEENQIKTIKEKMTPLNQILNINNFKKMKNVIIQFQDYNLSIFDAYGNGKREFDIYDYQNSYVKVAEIRDGKLQMISGKEFVENDTYYYQSITRDPKCVSDLNTLNEQKDSYYSLNILFGVCIGFIVVFLIFSLSIIKYIQSWIVGFCKDLTNDLIQKLRPTDNTSMVYTETSQINFENESTRNPSICMEINPVCYDNESFVC